MQTTNALKKIRNHQTGFTLVELMVVVAIIATLSGLIMAFVFNARSEARDMSRQSDLEQIKLGLKLYKEAYGEYPDYSTPVEIGVGGAIDTDLGRIIELKRDPLADEGGGEYSYMYSSNFSCNGDTTVAVYALNVENEKYVNADTLCGLAGQNYYVALVSGNQSGDSVRSESVNNPVTSATHVAPITPAESATSVDVPGCMDGRANNFNSLATVSDGSCTYGATGGQEPVYDSGGGSGDTGTGCWYAENGTTLLCPSISE